MKGLLKNLLYRWPSLLADIMHLKSNWNRDKYVFLKLLRKGDTVLDVGGNIGDYCTTFAKAVGPRGHVHTFEPVPSTFETLKATIADEGLGNVTLNQKAVSNESGQIEIHMPGDDHARPSIKKHARQSWDKEEEVHSFPCEATTLDKYVQEQGISSVDFLKIDVEGAEHLVLQGAEGLLKTREPLIFFEMWDSYMQDFGTTAEDFCKILRTADYDQFLVVQGDLHLVSNVESELPRLLEEGILNLLCGKKPKHEGRIARIKT